MSSPDPSATTSTTTTSAATTSGATSTAATTSTTTTKTQKTKAIKAVTSFSTMADADLAILAGKVAAGLTNNPNFTNLPVDMPTFNALVTSYTNAIQAALDGGANAKAVCAKDRKTVITDLKLLAISVQDASNGDMAIFTTSGFQAQQPTSTAGQPAAVPTIKNLDYGTTAGSLSITVNKAANASAYFIRYAAMANGQPGPWTTVTAVAVNKKLTISGLTSGASYGFQVQALGSTGYTEWCALETITCP